jgi:hypothetical protein
MTLKRLLNARTLLLAMLVLFLVLVGASMVLYPGGTAREPLCDGHRFLENYFCDLTHSPALNGKRNPFGAALGSAAFVAFGMALTGFCAVSGEIAGAFTRTMLSVSGAFSALGLFGVALFSSDQFGNVHALAVALALVPGFFAAIFALVSNVTSRFRLLAALGTLTLLLALADVGYYVHFLKTGGQANAMLPLLQKLAAAAFALWMALTALVKPRPNVA